MMARTSGAIKAAAMYKNSYNFWFAAKVQY